MGGVRAMLSDDGTCKGIGFVNYLDRTSAELAISIYNGTIMPDGNRLKVAIKMHKKADAPHVVPAPIHVPVPEPQVVSPATWSSTSPAAQTEIPAILVPPNVVLPLEATPAPKPLESTPKPVESTPKPVDWQTSSAALEDGNMIPAQISEEEKLRLRMERFGKV